MAKERSLPQPRDLGLRSDSFSTVRNTDLTPRVIANIDGSQKVGKDHFALTAPDPIVVFNFDNGLEGVVEKFVEKGKRIVVAGVPGSRGKGKYDSYHFARPIPERGETRRSAGYLERVKKLSSPIWERFISDLDDFYHSEARSGIVDTGGAAYALARFAFHGMDKGKPAPKDDPYGQKSGDMKAIFQGLVVDGYSYDKNVLWLHRVKGEWKNNEPTGRDVTEGYAGMPYEVQVNIRLEKKVRRGETTRVARVGDCRLNTGMEGEEFIDKEVRFSYIMAAITGTDEEVWQ